MKRRIRFRDRAFADLHAQAGFIAEDSWVAALRFYDAVDATCRHLARWPESGALYDSRRKRVRVVRLFPVRGFDRHLVFYRVENDTIVIVRILHSARNIPRIL